MSSAHIFYIPILIAMGFIGGFFAGKRAAEQEALEAQRRVERKKKLAAQGPKPSAAQARSQGPEPSSDPGDPPA